MKRKLVKQGHNTLTLSLPKKWCDRHSLDECNEIEILERGEFLLLAADRKERKGEVKKDVTNLDRSSIILLIQSLYRFGYDTIVINSKKQKFTYHLINKDYTLLSVLQNACSRLLGTEIVSTTENTYIIEVITQESREKFPLILRRILYLLNENYESLSQGLEKKEPDMLEGINGRHITTQKFLNCAFRILNKYGHEDAQHTTFYFAILSFLSKLSEVLKNIGGHIVHESSIEFLSNDCIKLIRQITDTIKKFNTIFYKDSLEDLSEIHKLRDIFKKDLYDIYPKLSSHDVYPLTTLFQSLDILLDLSQLKMAIHN
jgi:phosphate uptake regulator